MKGEPIYFADAAAFRRWLTANAMKEVEVEVGFVKKGAGSPALTWPLAVDEALCFGWIDGARRNVDEKRYQIRFTPRKAGSIWSAVNIRFIGRHRHCDPDRQQLRSAGTFQNLRLLVRAIRLDQLACSDR